MTQNIVTTAGDHQYSLTVIVLTVQWVKIRRNLCDCNSVLCMSIQNYLHCKNVYISAYKTHNIQICVLYYVDTRVNGDRDHVSGMPVRNFKERLRALSIRPNHSGLKFCVFHATNGTVFSGLLEYPIPGHQVPSFARRYENWRLFAFLPFLLASGLPNNSEVEINDE